MILGRANDEQLMVFHIVGGVFVFVIVVLWLVDNRRGRSI
jgi:hypothetical protein